MNRARRYYEYRIDKQDEVIEENERRMVEIRGQAMLDATELLPRDTPRVADAREEAEAARKLKWLPVRLDGKAPIDGDALAGLMESYPDLLDGGVPSGELNGWLISRGVWVSEVQSRQARHKEVEAEEAEARAAGEHVSDSPLYGSADAKRRLNNAEEALKELDAMILKRARELGLIHENREGVAWLPGTAAQGVESDPEEVSAIPFDADGNVDTGRLRANRYYRRTDDGSVWYWTGKEMVHTRSKRDKSDIVVENGEIARDLLVKGEIYEVEDGTRFVWDGGNFREVYEDPESGAWMLRSDPADKGPPPGMPGTRTSPREIMDVAENIQGEAKRFRVEADQIRGLALELMGVRERLRSRREKLAKRGRRNCVGTGRPGRTSGGPGFGRVPQGGAGRRHQGHGRQFPAGPGHVHRHVRRERGDKSVYVWRRHGGVDNCGDRLSAVPGDRYCHDGRRFRPRHGGGSVSGLWSGNC